MLDDLLFKRLVTMALSAWYLGLL